MNHEMDVLTVELAKHRYFSFFIRGYHYRQSKPEFTALHCPNQRDKHTGPGENEAATAALRKTWLWLQHLNTIGVLSRARFLKVPLA